MEQSDDALRRFEDMQPEERANAAQAASRYLLANDFASLDEACETRGLAMQDLWDEIMLCSRLPACSVPVFAYAT